jgi:hypothetical protein
VIVARRFYRVDHLRQTVLSAKLFGASGQLLKSVTVVVKDQPPQKCATGGHPEKRVVPVLGHIDAYDQM